MADADMDTILVRRLARPAKTSPEMPCPREPEGPQGLGEMESVRCRGGCQADPSNEAPTAPVGSPDPLQATYRGRCDGTVPVLCRIRRRHGARRHCRWGATPR